MCASLQQNDPVTLHGQHARQQRSGKSTADNRDSLARWFHAAAPHASQLTGLSATPERLSRRKRSKRARSRRLLRCLTATRCTVSRPTATSSRPLIWRANSTVGSPIVLACDSTVTPANGAQSAAISGTSAAGTARRSKKLLAL